MGTRPKVLLMIDNLHENVGGAERFMVGLATHLPRERFDVRTLTTRSARGPLLEMLEVAGIPHVNLGRRTKRDYHRLAGLARLLRTDGIDVLHTHKFGSNLSGTVIGAACRVPVIIAQEHTWSYEGRPLRKLLDGQLIGRLADRFVAVSRADRDRMISLEGVRRDKTVVIPAAYVPRAVASHGDLRAELGLPPDTMLVGMVANLRPQKAVEVLLDAYDRVAKELPRSGLVIAGEGPSRDGLERLVGEMGLAERVHFLGQREDVDAILTALDLAVLSSDFEGTPLLALECMAHGKALVATDVGGIRDVVDDGVTGLLVPRRDPDALAAAIVGLLRDHGRRAALGAAARHRLDAFTIEAVAGRFATLYDELLARARSRS